MANFTLEQDEQPVVEQTETQEEKEVEAKASETQQSQTLEKEEVETEKQEEPTIEFGGQTYTATQFKEMQEAFNNKAEWQKTNTQKAQEVADQRRQLEERQAKVAMLEGLAEKVQSNPELLKQVFAPKQERDYDAEIQAHWQQRPLDANSQEYVNWEYQKDILIGERSEVRATKRATEQLGQSSAQDHNTKVSTEAYAKYKDKLSKEEFAKMAEFINRTVVAPQGKYPENSYDIAYRNLYWDKEISDAKLSAAAGVIDPLLKAKPADGQIGKRQPDNQKTQSEIDEDAFIAEANARGRG